MCPHHPEAGPARQREAGGVLGQDHPHDLPVAVRRRLLEQGGQHPSPDAPPAVRGRDVDRVLGHPRVPGAVREGRQRRPGHDLAADDAAPHRRARGARGEPARAARPPGAARSRTWRRRSRRPRRRSPRWPRRRPPSRGGCPAPRPRARSLAGAPGGDSPARLWYEANGHVQLLLPRGMAGVGLRARRRHRPGRPVARRLGARRRRRRGRPRRATSTPGPSTPARSWSTGRLRCWGKGLAGRLGYGSDATILSAAAAPPVNLGAGRTARAIAAGDFHTCAILDDGSVKCWGFGANGRLGYGNTANVSLPAAVPPVNLGAGRRAVAITAGASHTCAILDTRRRALLGQRRAGPPRLGSALLARRRRAAGLRPARQPRPPRPAPSRRATSTPARSSTTARCAAGASASSGQLGNGGDRRRRRQRGAGGGGRRRPAGGRASPARSPAAPATPAPILDDGSVSCWGFGANGRLGYGNTTQRTTPGGPRRLGAGRTATAIAPGRRPHVRDPRHRRGPLLGLRRPRAPGIRDVRPRSATPRRPSPTRRGRSTSAPAGSRGRSRSAARPWMPAPRQRHRVHLHAARRRHPALLGLRRHRRSPRLRRRGAGGRRRASRRRRPRARCRWASWPACSPTSRWASPRARAQVALGGARPRLVRDGDGTPAPTPRRWPSQSRRPAGVTFTGGLPRPGRLRRPRRPLGGRRARRPAPRRPCSLTGARGRRPASHELAAQVAATSILDRANEDDRAAVASRRARLRRPKARGRFPRRLGMKVKSAFTAPRPGQRLTVSGILTLPRTRPPPRCAGRVQVRALVGKRVVAVDPRQACAAGPAPAATSRSCARRRPSSGARSA